MDLIRTLFSRVAALFGKRELDAELDEELRTHIDFAVEENLKRGMNAHQARTTALKEFGGMTQTKETYRVQRGLPLIEQVGRDLRFAVRQLLKSPGFTLVAMLTLALGVGANTAVFSLINGLLLRPLPVPHAEQLAMLRYGDVVPDQSDYELCTPFFRGLENLHEVFSDVFAYNGDTLLVKGQSGSENVPGMLVSGQFFQAMETAPLLGRYLTPQDDRPGGSPAGLAVVISEDLWNNRFNRAPDVVGRILIIANTPFTIVGVMPKRFIGPDPTQRPEIYAPLSADPIIDAPRNHIDAGIHAWWLVVGARLKPGMTMEQANAALLAVSNPILHEAGAADASFIAEREKEHIHFAAEPGSKGYTYARFLFRKPLVAMFIMCGGILLLACLNLASLLMARGVARQRELATRLAMGATRRRVIQQLLSESLLIAVLGTVAGLTAAPLVSHTLAALAENNWSEMRLDTSLDLRVFGFAALIAIVSSILIGLIPALQATAGNLNDHIKEGQQARPAFERRKILPRALMATEVAVALTLVIGAGLLATSLLRLFRSGAGFDPKGLVNIAFKVDKQQLEGDALMRVYQQLGEGLNHQPGVKSVSFEFIVPLSHRGWNAYYSAPAGGQHQIFLNAVGPNYFGTMRIPLYLGREFNWNDSKASGLKIILNQSAAKQFFPGQNAVGQQITYPREKVSYEVVGVVGDAKYREMQSPAPAAAYVPIQQAEQPKISLTAVVRTDGPLAPLAAAARALAGNMAPSIPAPVMTTVDEVLNKNVSAERMMALLSLFFAGCALLVTAIGLYGTLAYATARRTSEIGIRMALGARRAGVVAMVFRENVLIAAVGTGVGLIAAVLASRALASFLYETSPRDPSVLLFSVTALAFVASAASILPAVRAAQIDPMRALRNE
ncbi:MAG: ABC transporter permease [Terracidiphilus sp.]